jgi:Tfp pilus assembly protein PilO
VKRAGVLIILALTFVIGAVWYVGLFRPIDEARASAVRKNAAARREFQVLSATLSRLEGLESDRANQEALARRLDAAVPKNPDLGVFIVEANTIAGNAGISWISITPEASTTEVAPGFTAIPMQIKVEGGFFSILDYLSRMEQAKRLVVVDSITTTPLSPERTGGKVDPVNPQLVSTMRARIFTRAEAFSSTGATPTTTTTLPPPTTTSKKAGI